jgi:hypothetical protein
VTNRIVQDNNPRKPSSPSKKLLMFGCVMAGQFQHEIAAAYVINSGRVSVC